MVRPCTRRSFLARLAVLGCAPVYAQLALPAAGASDGVAVPLRVGANPSGTRVPLDFHGLSFELAELADPALFAPENISLVQSFRTLSPHGVLRFGGSSVERCGWKSLGDTAGPGTDVVLQAKALDALDGFLKAVGWTCLYTLPLRGSNAETVAHATYLANRLGSRLHSLSIGSGLDADAVAGALALADTVARALPAVRWTLPDFATGTLLRSAGEIAAAPTQRTIADISHHAARFSSAGQASLADLQRGGMPGLLDADAVRSLTAVRQVRLSQVSVVRDGGKAGVSNTQAAALWAAECALRAMASGYVGWNLHGFDRSTVDAPVAARDGDIHCAPQPVAQGLKFTVPFAGAVMLPVTFPTGDFPAAAFAGRRPDGKILAAILNRDAARPLRIVAPIFDTVQVLTGTSPASDDSAVRTVVRETSSRRTAEGQTFSLPPHTATLIVLH